MFPLRRWSRLLLAFVVLAIALVLLLPVWAAGRYDRAREEFEHHVGPLRLAGFSRGEIPESDNAARWLVAGSRALTLEGDDLGALRHLVRRQAGAWTATDRESASRLIERNLEAIELLAHSRECSGSTYWIDYEAGAHAEIPPLLDLVKGARLILVATRMSALSGDLEGVRHGVEVLQRFTDSLARESTLITTIVSLAMHRLLLQAVGELLLLPQVDAAVLRDAIGLLERLQPAAAVHRAVQAEAAVAVSLPGDAAHGDGTVTGTFERAAYRYAEDLFRASLLDDYRRILETLDTPWNQTALALRQGQLRHGLAKRSPLWVNLVDIVARLKAVESSRELALAGLRLRVRGLEDGNYPPSHPFRTVDPYGGQPFEYTVTSESTAIVASPRAEELWQQETEASEERQPPPFAYELPAPDPGGSVADG